MRPHCSPVNGKRETSSVEAARSDEDVVCSVAVLFLGSFVLGSIKPAALSNAFAAGMKNQTELSIS